MVLGLDGRPQWQMLYLWWAVAKIAWQVGRLIGSAVGSTICKVKLPWRQVAIVIGGKEEGWAKGETESTRKRTHKWWRTRWLLQKRIPFHRTRASLVLYDLIRRFRPCSPLPMPLARARDPAITEGEAPRRRMQPLIKGGEQASGFGAGVGGGAREVRRNRATAILAHLAHNMLDEMPSSGW